MGRVTQGDKVGPNFIISDTTSRFFNNSAERSSKSQYQLEGKGMGTAFVWDNRRTLLSLHISLMGI